MDTKLQLAVNILKKYNQEKILDFYNELNDIQKEKLLNQILSIDFDKIQKLYTNSKKDDSINSNRITPLQYIDKSNISNNNRLMYINIGENIIRNSELAIITLAGGQGSRLGYKGPKGTYEIDVPPKKSLFEFICDKLKNAFYKYNVYLPWYIMTSPYNDYDTKVFFEQKNFFGYPKEKIYFFKQHTLPIIDLDSNLILDNIYSIAEGSNGNGDVFKSYYSSNVLNNMIKQNIKWISISGVDNILSNIIDPLFIGITISDNSLIASKSISKSEINSDEWIFANVDNMPTIINPQNLSNDMIKSVNLDGTYNYSQINILSHLFNISAFNFLKDVNLPYHRAFKKSDFINEEGMKVVPSVPNSFKFEKFIFDSFKYFKKLTLLKVNSSEEFAPIKAFTGNATPETALKLYLQNNI